MCPDAQPPASRRLFTLAALLLASVVLPSAPALAQRGPDLEVSDISFSPAPVAGVQTVATARLVNEGTASSGAFNVKWFLDGVQVGYGGHTSLAPGEVSSGNVRYDWTPTAGQHTLRWEYYKDGSLSDGDDAVYVDDIYIGGAP